MKQDNSWGFRAEVAQPLRLHKGGYCRVGPNENIQNAATLPLSRWDVGDHIDMVITCSNTGFDVFVNGVKLGNTHSCWHDPVKQEFPVINDVEAKYGPNSRVVEWSWTFGKY